MDRLKILRAGIGLDSEVLEIGPYFNPIAPRREGYRVTTIDVCDAEELRTRAAGDPNLGPTRVPGIEDVDLVGSACDLADLTVAKYGVDRKFDWILSSHNFEHLPDPIRFLQQCAAVLDINGTLRMAVPDKRFCFDHFRQITEVSEWLQAYHERRTKPTIYQAFREETHRSTAGNDGRWTPTRQTLGYYRSWFGPDGHVPDGYIDTHCWAFTPESFQLLLNDVRAFGLVSLRITRISEPQGLEFFVDLCPTDVSEPFSEDDYFSTRESLLQRCLTPEAPERLEALRRIPGKVIREVRRLARQVATIGSRHR
jgi:SAM-dependent methyltransferase